MSATPTDTSVVDRAALRRQLGDDALVAEAVELYLAEAPQMLLAIDAAALGGDAGAVGRAAHELKGTLANMRCEQASRLACEIEECGRAGDVTGARNRLGHLRRALLAVARAFTA